MGLLNVQEVGSSGLSASYAAASASGDEFVNDGDTYVHAKNGGGSPLTMTINRQVNCSLGSDHDLVLTVPAGGEVVSPRLNKKDFNNRTTDRASITYSGVTSLTVAAIRSQRV